MKPLALLICLALGATAAYGQDDDAEIITNGLRFQEANGIMRIVGEMKNNTRRDFTNLKVRIKFKRGRTVVQQLTIRVGSLEAGRQGKLDTRSESVSERWNDYDLAFFDGDDPLFWRLPKK